MGRGRGAVLGRGGRDRSPSRARRRRACCCCSRASSQTLLVEGDRTEPAGLHQPPTWMGAISVLTGGALGVRMRGRDRVPLARDRRPTTSAGSRSRSRASTSASCSQVAPVMSRHHGASSRTASGSRRSARWRPASPTSSTTPPPPRSARRRRWPRRSRSSAGRSARFVESGVERADAAKLVALQNEAVAHAASRTELDALDAADAEDDIIDRLEDLGIAEPWRLAEPLAAAGRRPGLARPRGRRSPARRRTPRWPGSRRRSPPAGWPPS